MTEQQKAVRVVIRGRVQGVGYRLSLVQQAAGCDLDGWCRNRPDGSVEAALKGPAAGVDKVIAWCWQGPRLAQVDEVVVTPFAPTDIRDGFHVRY